MTQTLPTPTPVYGARIGLTRAADALGAIVALDGDWHDVLTVRRTADGALVQLETLSPNGALFYRHLPPGTVLQEALDFPRLSRTGEQL